MTGGKVIKRFLLSAVATAVLVLIGAGVLAWSGLHDDTHRADVALVLGNTVMPDGTPSARLKARLDRTLELYHGGDFPLVIVSGGFGKEGFDEAAVMKDYLIAHGIPEDRIIADNRGDTTYASAQNTLRVLRDRKIKSVMVVSQYFHIPRAKLALEKFEISPVYSAHARYFEARDLYSTARELAGYIEYSFRKYEQPPE